MHLSEGFSGESGQFQARIQGNHTAYYLIIT